MRHQFVSLLLRYPTVWVLAAIGIPVAIAIFSSRNAAFDSAKVREMISTARSIQAEVGNFIAMNDRLPVSAAELGHPPDERSASADARSRTTFTLRMDGSIVVTGKPDSGSLAGKSIVLTPLIEGERLVWRCSSPDLSETVLPQSCRKRPADQASQ